MSTPLLQSKETDLEWTAVVSKNDRSKLNRKPSSKKQHEDNVQKNVYKQRKKTQNGTSSRIIREKQHVKESIGRRQNRGETKPSQRENLQNPYRHLDQRNIYNDPRQNYVNAWPQLGANYNTHQYGNNVQRNWNIGINQSMDNQLYQPRQDMNSEINDFPPLGQHVWVNTPYTVPAQNIHNVHEINKAYPFPTHGIHQSQNRKTMNIPEIEKDIMHVSNVNARNSKSKPQQKKNNQDKKKNEKKILQIKSKEKLITSPKSSSQLDPHAAAFIHFDNMLPMGTTVKGKQKIGKRKKMLTPLKKQILKERLKQWKISQGINDDPGVGEKKTECTNLSCITFLKGYVQHDELEDDDEYNEIIQDFRALAEKVGDIDGVFIPRYFQNDMQVDECLAFVKFVDGGDALAAKACWNGMVLGGTPIVAEVIPADFLSKRTSSDMTWTDGLKDLSYAELMFSTESDNKRGAESTPGTVVLSNVLTEDDLEDNECLEETLNDIKALASDFGPLQSEGESISVNEITNEIFLHFQKLPDANSAVLKLNGSMFGGAICEAKTISDGLDKNSVTSKIFLENILSEDDYEDEECLEATIEDIRCLVKEFGTVENIEVHLEGIKKGRVDICFNSLSGAEAAVAKLNGLVIGGLVVSAALDLTERDLIHDSMVILENFLSEDDFDDEDCLEETKNDLESIMEKFGKMKSMNIHVQGEQKGQIHVEYNDPDAAQNASKALHNSTFGGKKVSVLVKSSEGKNVSSASEENKDANITPAPIYSGNKVIPEQYAECKRVPKIPNAGVPREYAKRIDDENVIPLLFEMLGELMRLQLRAKENKNAKARRRLVMGLREVARGIRAKKVKMVVLANNLDEYGALDSKLEAILKLANDNDIPVIFDLNKRKIGKALGKTIKVSVVGIENADGAYDSFKKLRRLCGYN